jgi:DNA replication licensing factor MCM6
MAAPGATAYVPDPYVNGLDGVFRRFIETWSPAGYDPAAEQAAEVEGEVQQALPYYAYKIKQMVEQQQNVLPVDFSHVQEFDGGVADMVKAHFERAEPVMRVVLQDYVREQHPGYLQEATGVDKQFFLGFFGMPTVETLRDLRTECIGQLLSFSGTVTRTTEVRPELFLGTFSCFQCGSSVANVEQQYKYTQPLICPNRACNNK